MPLPFLTDDANRELVLRLQRAAESERKQYTLEHAKVLQDWTDRGMRNSTGYTGAFVATRLDSARRMAAIMRSEIFALVEADNLRLSKADVAAISEQLKLGLEATSKSLEAELEREERQLGPGASIKSALKHKMEEAIQRETIAEVMLCVTALRRKQKAARRKWWLERIEKLVWIVVGVAGTLFVQWLAKRPSP